MAPISDPSAGSVKSQPGSLTWWRAHTTTTSGITSSHLPSHCLLWLLLRRNAPIIAHRRRARVHWALAILRLRGRRRTLHLGWRARPLLRLLLLHLLRFIVVLVLLVEVLRFLLLHSLLLGVCALLGVALVCHRGSVVMIRRVAVILSRPQRGKGGLVVLMFFVVVSSCAVVC
ncbi:hypothetical protein DFH27DRAFT_537127 [Peziza echinospora]|nr:hypothetical protein DFH27DRAFT_537127 [Peziza echinospora]